MKVVERMLEKRPHGIESNSVLCLQCGKWIHGRCAVVKWVTPKFSRNFTCRKCDGNICLAVEQEGKVM